MLHGLHQEGHRALKPQSWAAVSCSPQAAKLQPVLPVLEEATEPEGNELGNRLQDKDNGEDVIANLQGFVENLW